LLRFEKTFSVLLITTFRLRCKIW